MVGIHETWRSCSLKYFLSNLLCKNGTGIECTFESSGKHDMWDIFEELSLGRAKKFPLQFFLQKREQYCANINGMEKLYWNPDNFSCPGANFDFRLLEKLHHGSKQVIQKEGLNLETLPLIILSLLADPFRMERSHEDPVTRLIHHSHIQKDDRRWNRCRTAHQTQKRPFQHQSQREAWIGPYCHYYTP